MTDLLSSLNEYQKQAVTTDNSAVLVLAGAGSGKTRVLIHRIAWCCQQGVMPHQFLALTFTNKAAAEMKVRIENLLPGFASNIWIGTFHGIAYRLLKMHWKQANLSQNFQIIDTDDQTQLIKRLVKEAKLSDDTDAKSIQWQINHYKDEGLRADYIESGFQDDPNVLLIYKRYEQLCQRSGLVDFAELLLRSLELFRQNPDLVAHYQDRFQHILVDEFQDTNSIQYAWIKLITGNNLFIVGDDDQSIYSWRGAKIENLTTFQSDFPQHEIIRLEQNYRSTNTILSAANAVIKFNQQRLGKDLWCEGAEGDLITVFKAMNEKDEAIYTIKEIKKLCSHGVSNRDIAILYRSNALSRNFEELLVSNGIAYRIYGGLRFFERAEIKDVLAYLKLIHNSDDDSSYIRIVNKPTRGIGQKAQSVVHELANEQSISLWEASVKVCEQGLLKAKAKSSLVNFIQLINDFKAMTESDSFSNLTNSIIEKTGLQAMHEKEHSEKAIMRIENIKEFLVAVKQFDSEHQQTDAVVEDFLSKVSLDAGVNGETSEQDSVNLMTLHSAKGLEFSYVFICGLEQG
ncbi:MAG: UvrD-helicase domain-containing protein, partial [Methylococcales bacterium]|nr:UvrD-helicase domain-containing protein [Methylococcales bacterium]